MKATKKEIKNGVVYITVESTNIVLRTIKKFAGLIKHTESVENITTTVYSSNRTLFPHTDKFRIWTQEPDKLLVGDRMTFQLNEWNLNFVVEEDQKLVNQANNGVTNVEKVN